MFPTYAASNTGKIKNIKRNTLVKQSAHDVRDYQRVCISYENKKYTKKVSRMIWAAFNGCECDKVVSHIDGNVMNNNITNLECVTPKENSARRDIYSKNCYDLNDVIKKEIITAYKNKTKSVWKLSKEYNIPETYLYTTFKRGSWEHLWITNDTLNLKNSH